MNPQPENSFWYDPPLRESGSDPSRPPREFERLWRGFMTARVGLGLVLVVLQGGNFLFMHGQSSSSMIICVAYFATALVVRLKMRPQQWGTTFDAQWLRSIGVDVLTFAALQMLQNSSINYTPLFALPVLMTSILGTMMLAMGAAAGVTLLLFANAAWSAVQARADLSPYLLQAALTGAGCFAISFIASQMATRLASVELSARRSQLAAAVQRQVNELVIESLADGIMVVDAHSQLRSANPAARLLLGNLQQSQTLDLNLNSCRGWQALQAMVATSFATGQAQQSGIDICHEGQGQRCLWVRTQLTTSAGDDAQGLCVVFMQDQREVQARIRAEKLAGMGRMSAAVAHEIRNPLAAITQANALLAEDLQDPAQQRLAGMVQQNALRLEKIVHDVLHLAHAPSSDGADTEQWLNLADTARRIGRDWKNQHTVAAALLLNLPNQPIRVLFDPEHLRRILINLLDNAHRYASGRAQSIQVDMDTLRTAAGLAEPVVCVWSDGAPLDPSVEQHLFEPFFSSESRSSGLGLYISRELCESHGAVMFYQRSTRKLNENPTPGNEFSVVFRTRPEAVSAPSAPLTPQTA